MGRELQKKKNRSSIPKIKLNQKSKRVNPLGNTIIAKNWNPSQTMTQNYRRLGLTSRLNSLTGGAEVSPSKTSTTNKLAITSAKPTALTPSFAHVERDPNTGKIIRVIHEKAKKSNPLNDPLMSDSDDEESHDKDGGVREEGEAEGNEESTRIVKELEEKASMVPERKVRKQSQREKEWIARLVQRYGEDTKSMTRDRKLNPMQQTEADISKRVRKWRDEGGAVEI